MSAVLGSLLALQLAVVAPAIELGPYPDGSMLTVSLAGHAGDAARVTVVPAGANASFQRYQGFINDSALTPTARFRVVADSADYTVLSRPGWSLNVSKARPVVSLVVGGAEVSRDLTPPTLVRGAACDPPGWKPVVPGIAKTVAPKGTCLRVARTLSQTPPSPGSVCCTAYQDPSSRHYSGPSCDLGCPAPDNEILRVTFADYGKAIGVCGLQRPDPSCTAANRTAAIAALFTKECVGARRCSVARHWADWGDPCPGDQDKRVTVAVACGNPKQLLHPSPARHRTGIENEHVYGFGQTVTAGLSAAGTTKFIATFSRTLASGPSHAPSPSYISLGRNRQTNVSVAHGFFLNSHGYSAFDVGMSNPDEILVSSPDPIYDYFLFAGPTPAAVIGQYSEVVGGRMSLPPKWAMGMKYDPAEKGYNTSFIETVVSQFAARGIRPDRVVLEPAWQGEQYNWDTGKFPDVTALVRGIAPTKLVLWEHPILDQKTSFHTSLADAGCLARGALAPGALGEPAPTQFADLTLPKCQQLWKQYQLRHAINSGAMGFKLDEDDVDADIGFNDSTIFPSGFRGYEYHNIQGYILQRLYHEAFASIGKRTWLQSRGGFAGSQAYPTNSYSDGYDYRTYVRVVVNSGFSGLVWAPEMRHATCGPDHSAAEHADFARRVQLMFLSPQAQYNAWDGADGTTLWPSGGPGAANCSATWLAMFRMHWQLRDGLAGYLYSAFEAQSRTGLPVARPLVVDTPEDSQTWEIDDQFLVGDDIMFAPAAMDGDPQSPSRKVYFPAGPPSWHGWFDGANGTVYPPGALMMVATPIMTAPLFVKGNTPVFYRGQGVPSNTLGVHVWRSDAVDCSLDAAAAMRWSHVYDDDGETMDHAIDGARWRAAAGFASCIDGTTKLRFHVLEAGYSSIAYTQMMWTVRRTNSRPVRIDCSDDVIVLDWRHSSSLGEFHLTIGVAMDATAEHRCTAYA